MRLRILLAAACAVASLAAMSTIVLARKAAPHTIKTTLKNVNGVAVGSVTFTAASRLAQPKPSAQTMLPLCATATATPVAAPWATA